MNDSAGPSPGPAARTASPGPAPRQASARAVPLRPLSKLVPLVLRYPRLVAAALVALLVAALATLAIPLAVRRMIDFGFARDGGGLIDSYFVVLIGVAAVGPLLKLGPRGAAWVTNLKAAGNDTGGIFGEMKHALIKMGFTMERVEIPRHHHRHQVMSFNPDPFVMPTLHRYMRERGGEQWKAVMLVNVTDHYVVINRDTVSDNHQQDKHYTEHRWNRKKIDKAWIVKRKPKR